MPWSAGASWAGRGRPPAHRPTRRPRHRPGEGADLGRAPDRAQQRGHPLGALLHSRARPRPGCAGPGALMVAVRRAAGHRAPRSCGKLVVATERRTSCPGWTRWTSAGSPTAWPVRRLTAAEAREHEPHVAAVAGAARGRDRHHRLRRGVPRPWSAGWPRPAPTSGSAPRSSAAARRGSRTVVRSTTGDVAVDVAGQLRRPAERPGGAAGGRRPDHADRPVPRRVLRAAPERRAPGARA